MWVGSTSRMRWRPVEAATPACSTIIAIGFASYSRRRRPGLAGSFVSRGYMNRPPRIALDAFLDVLADRRLPEPLVRGIDSELSRHLRNAHVGMREQIGADIA